MKIIIIGGRGNGTVIASVIEDCIALGADLSIAGFLNDHEHSVGDYRVLGGIKNQDWRTLPDDVRFIYAMSNVKEARDRHQMLIDLSIPVSRFATIVHPTASVSKKAELGNGVVIMPHVMVSADCVVGNHTQLYAQSFIGHDTVLEEMVFVANNASVGGRVIVKTGAHVGTNSTVIERLSLGAFSIVGAGAVVIRNVAENTTVVGNPAKPIAEVKT